MKTRIILIAVLFVVATAFYPAAPAARASKVSSSMQKRVWKNYCGNISAGCNGNIEVKIASDLSGAYLLEVKDLTGPLTFSTVSISPVPGSAGVFSVNVNYDCGGVWTNYTGGAYTSVCP